MNQRITRIAGVDLEDVFRKDDRVYKVVGITDKPTVTLEATDTGERVHLVIGSPLFLEYTQLTADREGARWKASGA
jgi:hypothetical protein